MKLLSVFTKTAREQTREIWVLLLSLAFAPLFVLVYWLFTGGNATTSYGVAVLDNDRGYRPAGAAVLHAGDDVVEAMAALTFQDGSPILRVSVIESREAGEALLRDREAAALLIIPADFSEAIGRAAVEPGGDPQGVATASLPGAGPATQVELVGDLTNPYYTVAAVVTMSAVESYSAAVVNEHRTVGLVETALGDSAARTEFELYMPGLFVLAVIMMLFQASMTVAREIEGGRLKRLRLTRIRSIDLLGGISAWLVIVGVAEVLVAFGTASAFGFRSRGALGIAILTGAITSLSIIGVGMIVASFSRTVSQAFVIANFPFGLFMFLSGAAVPVRLGGILTIAGRRFGVTDLLPPTHAVHALNKVFTLGAGLGDLTFELSALVILSLLYFGVGVTLFRRRHFRAAR